MAERNRILFVCEVCLVASDRPGWHHGRELIECDAGCAGDDCTHPVTDAAGRILTHAPKWWVYRHRRAGQPARP